MQCSTKDKKRSLDREQEEAAAAKKSRSEVNLIIIIIFIIIIIIMRHMCMSLLLLHHFFTRLQTTHAEPEATAVDIGSVKVDLKFGTAAKAKPAPKAAASLQS